MSQKPTYLVKDHQGQKIGEIYSANEHSENLTCKNTGEKIVGFIDTDVLKAFAGNSRFLGQINTEHEVTNAVEETVCCINRFSGVLSTAQGSLIATLVRDGPDLLLVKDCNGQRVAEILHATLTDVAWVSLYVTLINPSLLSVYTSSTLSAPVAAAIDFPLFDFFGYQLALSGPDCQKILQTGAPRDWNQLLYLRDMLKAGSVTAEHVRTENFILIKAMCKLVVFGEFFDAGKRFLAVHLLKLLLNLDPLGPASGSWLLWVTGPSSETESPVHLAVKLMAAFTPENVIQSVSISDDELSANLNILTFVLQFLLVKNMSSPDSSEVLSLSMV
jgi:hypothetical protein